jgi:hypothetical protein
MVPQLFGPLIFESSGPSSDGSFGFKPASGSPAWLAGRCRGVLYGVTPFDPQPLAGAACVLAATIALAAWVPARRAAGVSAMEAMRID